MRILDNLLSLLDLLQRITLKQMKSLEIRILFLDIKISRKEAKESILWLRLLRDMNQEFTTEFEKMIQECDELRKILSAIINKA